MLAFDDAALARLIRRARDVPWRKRRAWLLDVAQKLDPPTGEARTPEARRQAKARARRKNGLHIYRLELSDRAVEGIVDMLIATQKLTDAEAFDHRRIETMLARLLEEQGAQWAR